MTVPTGPAGGEQHGVPAGLRRFNAAPHEEVAALLTRCVDVPRWADAVAGRRPYGSVEEALAAGRTAADPWSEEELDRALAAHPRIGERPRGQGPAAGAAEHSAREQAGVQRDEETAARLAEGNRAYEERFGHVFLIRARGRDAGEILAELERRMANDPAAERAETAAQLREIALLRLEEELTSQEAP